MSAHFGRGWASDPFIEKCGCGKAACGLVDGDKVSPDCEQHGLRTAKTIRSWHDADDCPGPQTRHMELPKTIVFGSEGTTNCLSTKDLRELIYQCCGAATQPLMEDNPDYTFPSDKVAAAIRECLEAMGHGHLAHPKPKNRPVDLTRESLRTDYP